MKLYLDLIFIINFLFDLLLLATVSIILRRNIKVYRLILGALLGALSIFILFIPFTSSSLFFIKIIISILMVLVTFGYRDIKYFFRNLLFLYTTSIILGGFLYFLNLEFSYHQEGLIFYHHGLSINFVFLLILSPIIIYIYIKQGLELKNNYHNYYEVDVYFKDGTKRKLNGFLDTGNHLQDPYQKRAVILTFDKYLESKIEENNMVLVPYDALNYHGLLKCLIPLKVDIVGIGERKNVLIGISKQKMRMDGIDCLIPSSIMEGSN